MMVLGLPPPTSQRFQASPDQLVESPHVNQRNEDTHGAQSSLFTNRKLTISKLAGTLSVSVHRQVLEPQQRDGCFSILHQGKINLILGLFWSMTFTVNEGI